MSNNKEIIGDVIDSTTREFIKGAQIIVTDLTPNLDYFESPKTFRSDKNGDFTIKLPYDTENPPSPSSFNISISKNGYGEQKINVFKGNGEYVSQLNTIQLNPIKSDLTKDKNKFLLLNEFEIESLVTPLKDIDYFTKQRLSDSINKIKGDLTGKALDLISNFGVTNIYSYLNTPELIDKIESKVCPSQENIDNIIRKKNSLVKVLNQQLKLIDSTTKIIGVTQDVLQVLDIAANLLKIVPIPVAAAVNAVREAIKATEKTIDKLYPLTIELTTILLILKSALLTLITILNILDKLIQNCYPNNEQEQIAESLLTQTQELNRIQNNSPQNDLENYPTVNGFTFRVESEITESPLKRKRAIAISPNGVVTLKGEWSFSSVDRILVDELIFYIQQNDLKAN